MRGNVRSSPVAASEPLLLRSAPEGPEVPLGGLPADERESLGGPAPMLPGVNPVLR